MARPAPTRPAREPDDVIAWDDRDADAELGPPAPREETPPRGRKAKSEAVKPKTDAVPVVPLLEEDEDEDVALAATPPAARERPRAEPGFDDDPTDVLPAPEEPVQPPRKEPRKTRPAQANQEIGGLIYLIALALVAAALSATVVLVLF
jgi:hypothetical protein